MPTVSVPLFNTDPNVQADYAKLQQQQAMAQALMKEGMTPMDISNRSIGGVAYHVSPLEGIAKMLQTYVGQQGMQDSTQQQASLAAQAYGALLNKYQPGTDPSYSDQQRQDAESAGMPGPGTDGMGPPDPQKMAAALMTQQPAQGGQNPNNPNGIPAQLIAGYTAGMVPKEVFEAQAARYKPTDATVQALQGGMDPMQANRASLAKANTDPKIFGLRQAGFSDDQIHQMMAAEAQKGNTMEGRPGQSLYTFNGSGPPQLSAVAPDPNNNMQFNVNGGQVSAQPVPGAVPSKSNMAGGTALAGATGTTNGSLHMVTMPDGSVVPARGSEIPPLATQAPAGALPPGMDADRAAIYQHEMQAAQQRLATAKTPEEQARAQQDVAALTRETQRLGLRLGQSTAAKVGQEAGAKLMNDLPMQLQQSKQTVTGLENAYKTIEAMGKSGPGVSKTVNALAVLNNMGVPLMQGDTNGYQTLKKFLENSASTAAASNGFTGSDARFEQFKNGQPNAETMNPDALKGAIRYVLSQHDAAIARAQFIQQAAQANPNDPNAVQKAQQQWAKTYNPRYFEAQRMAPEDQRAMVGKMSPQEAQAFLAWRKANRVQ